MVKPVKSFALPNKKNRSSNDAEFSLSKGLVERLYWLIRLRWIAVAGVIIVVSFVNQILKVPLPVFPLCAVAVAIGIYNLIFLLLLVGIKKKRPSNLFRIANGMANLQISLDLVCLTVLVHLSGGIENPFIFYFIFHMIIASILLSRRAAFLQASFAVFLFSSMIFLEYFSFIQHNYLRGFGSPDVQHNFIYVGGVSFVFVSTLYIAVYMASSISSRLRERERRLKEANELLKEKDRIKSEYVLRVSHDIKEHLAAIESCIEPVTAGITGSLNEGQADLLRRADERTGKLLLFVKALLEITRLKLSRKSKMDYFSIDDVVKNAVAYVEAGTREKDINLTTHIDPSVDKVQGERPYIEETISNILANSIKYTPKNGRVRLEVTDKGKSILILIDDSGIGIPRDEIGKVFDEFYRARNAKNIERNGTGLGLSIAKQVVERHNGKIWVESEEGKGSSFYIMLPK